MSNAVDWKVHTYAQLSSTQDYVKELGDEGLPEGTVVQCLTQTKGRGRHGRTWTSPMGGLYMSALLRPQCAAAVAGQLSFVVAVAVSAAMDQALGAGDHRKTLKWPNDILIDGKKCAGILLESGMAGAMVNWLAVGVGINIMSAPEGGTCLQEAAGGKQVPIHPFRDIVLSHLSAYYMHWKTKGFAEVREAWMAQAHGLGQEITARTGDAEHKGIFRGINEKGELLLEGNGGVQHLVTAAEIVC